MKVCFFGTYNFNYSRNSSIRQGLIDAGVTVVDVNVDLPNSRMELPEDFTLDKSMWRIWRKVKAYWSLMLRSGEVLRCDYIVVLHPGHLDLPFAWILKVIGGKKLIFDTSISPYDTMFVGRNIAARNSLKARLVFLSEKLLLGLPDKLFVDTTLMKNFISNEFGIAKKKIFMIPLGANSSVYKPGKITKKRSNKISVLFFGLYSEIHGAFTILHAAKTLKKNFNIHFSMLGDGHLKDSFVDYVKKNNLKNVTFIGFQPELTLVKYIQKADIMLGIFSNNFLFDRVIPNKVYAALACKKALITAEKKPLKEFFKHKKNIYFTKSSDPKSLSAAIIELSKNGFLRNSVAEFGYETYLREFTTQKIGIKFKENLKKV